MRILKKLVCGVSTHTQSILQPATKRLFIHDIGTEHNFLIDTGSDKTVLKASQRMKDSWRQTPTKHDDEHANCYAANGTPIGTYGKRLLKVSLGLRREFTWSFTVADVTSSIIGADFLSEFGLLVDLKRKRLIDTKTGLSSKGELISSIAPQVTAIDVKNKLSFLLSEFKELLDDKPSFRVKEKANVTHFIETSGPPIATRARRLNPQKYEFAKKEFTELIRLLSSIEIQLRISITYGTKIKW